MKKVLLLTIIPAIIVSFFVYRSFSHPSVTDGAPPFAEEDLEPPDRVDRYAWLRDWRRPEGPPKVGLQVGHWKNDELPDELKRLEDRTGSSGGGKSEWEVNLAIAQETKTILEDKGVEVDLLPATVPEKYLADVFVAIHADGSTDPAKSGFKAATPRRDLTGKANRLLDFIESEYENATNFPRDPNVTRNMRGYYAFAWWRYDHTVHPMTASVIVETGFLTSSADRRLIVNRPEVAAGGIASGIISFLESENLLENYK